MEKYEIATGQKIDLDAEVIQEQRLNAREKTRSRLAFIVTFSCILALLIAFGHGALKNDFGSLQIVWSFAAMPLGAIIAHYFGERHTNEENN